MTESHDNFVEINIRSRREIVDRILILRTLFDRGDLELLHLEGIESADSLEESRFDLLAEVIDANARHSLTDLEFEALSTSVGELDEDVAEALALEIEALAALAAATGMIERLPTPPEIAVQQPDFAELVRDLERDRIEELVTVPGSGSAAALREYLEILLWRVEIELERREADGEALRVIDALISEVIAEAVEAGLLEQSASGDFEFGSSAIVEWSLNDVEVFYLAMTRRTHAINWLCGFGEDWSDTTGDD